MNAFLDSLRTVCLCSIGIIALFLLLSFLRTAFQIVGEGKSAVIERTGKFARLAGPGLIWVTPKLERVAGEIIVRAMGEIYRFDNVWLRDFVPVTVELVFSYRRGLTNFSLEQQKKFAYYSTEEWQRLLKAHLNKVLQEIATNFQFNSLVGKDPVYRNQFELALTKRLRETLPSDGVFLDDDEGVTFKVYLPREIHESLINITRTNIDAQTKGALISNLLQRYSGLSEAFILSAASLITGQELGAGAMPPPLIFASGSAAKGVRPLAEISSADEQPPLLDQETPDGEVWRQLKLPPGKQEGDSPRE